MSFLKFWKHLLVDQFTLYMGGGGGGQSGPTQTNVQNTNIPEYARPYTETMLGTAQQQIYNYSPEGNVTGFKPYIPYGATVDSSGNITNTAQEQASAAVAPFSPLQQMSFYNAANLGLPGQYNTGTGYAALGGIGAANVADRAAMAGQQYNRMATSPYATQAFMSPYIQSALQPQLQEMQRQYDITGAQERSRATTSGAFGGNRQALMQAENQRNKNIAMNQAIGQGYQNAFQQAQQAQQFGANLGLQGYGTALQGTGQLTGAGTALANIGSQQLQGQQGILGLQNQMGTQMQTQEQNKINQAIQNYAMQQQYPMQQLAAMSGLLRGLPLQSATTQSYQAAPSAISQLSGLGLTGAAAYGMMKKEGGVIKSYAGGGTVDPDGDDFAEPQGMASGGISQAISRKVLMNPDAYSKQTIDRSTKDGIIDDIVGLAAIQQKNKDEKEKMARAALLQPKPPSVKDQILAERAALDQQGLEAARSNLPTEYAGGGIVAFADGGDIEHFDEGGSAFSEDLGKLKDWYKEKAAASVKGITEPMRDIKNYFTIPRQAATDADAQPGGFYATGTNQPATPAPAAPVDNLKVVRDNKGAPTSKLSQLTGGPSEMDSYAKDAGGIDSLIKQLTGDLKASEQDTKDAKKEAKLMAMLQAGLGIMGGTSPYAAANFKGAIPGLQSYQEEMRGIRADENKRLGQIAALNLKGAELKQELKKLGITEKHYNDWAKVYSARAAGSAGANYGPITNETYLKLKDKYTGLAANPKSDPAFFNSLPKDVQAALGTKVGSPSYQRGLEAAKGIASQQFGNDINQMRILAARKGPNASSIVDTDL